MNRYCSHISVVEKSLQHHYMDVMELVSSLYRFAMNNEILLEDFSGDMGKMYTGLLEMEPEALKSGWWIPVFLFGNSSSLREIKRPVLLWSGRGSMSAIIMKMMSYLWIVFVRNWASQILIFPRYLRRRPAILLSVISRIIGWTELPVFSLRRMKELYDSQKCGVHRPELFQLCV